MGYTNGFIMINENNLMERDIMGFTIVLWIGVLLIVVSLIMFTFWWGN